MPHTATKQSEFIDECFVLAKMSFNGLSRNEARELLYTGNDAEYVNFAQILLRKVHELYRSDEYAYSNLMSCHTMVKIPVYYSCNSEYCSQSRTVKPTKSFTAADSCEVNSD